MSAMRSSAFTLIAIAAFSAIFACTTDVADEGMPSLGHSTLLAASAVPIKRIVTDDTNVYWFDAAGGIFSCAQSGCNQKPTVLAPRDPVRGAPTLVVLAKGKLFFTSAQLANNVPSQPGINPLYMCPLSGCPQGPTQVGPFAGIESLAAIGDQIVFSTFDHAYACPADNCDESARILLTGSCANDHGCPPSAPVCSMASAGAPTGRCVECDQNHPCSNGKTCDVASNRCGDCIPGSTSGSTCTGSTPVCEPNTRTCVGCTTTTPCANGKVCVGNACVACDGDYGSGGSTPCPAGTPMCTSAGCQACNSLNCVAPRSCGIGGFCTTPCTSPNDAGAPKDAGGDAAKDASKDASLDGAAPGSCEPTTHFCYSGYCTPRFPNGVTCNSSDACLSGKCEHGVCGSAKGEACSSAADCAPGVPCAPDGKCGLLEGAPCGVPDCTQGVCTSLECRTGYCPAGTCSSSPYPNSSSAQGTPNLAAGTAVGAGRLWFAMTYGSSLGSCPLDTCPAGVTPVATTSFGSSSRIVGATDDALVYLNSSQVAVCNLPNCDRPQMATTYVYNLTAPPQFIDKDIIWTLPGIAYGQPPSFASCTRASCSTLAPLSPDPELGPNGYAAVTLTPTKVIWATEKVFNAAGSLLLVSPR